jgi:hypothetical protein
MEEVGEEKKPSTVQEIRARSQKLVTLKSGLAFLVRRVDVAFLAQLKGSIPDLADLAKVDDPKAPEIGERVDGTVKAYGAMDRILEEGCLDPRVSLLTPVPEGCLQPSELSLQDRTELAMTIIEHSGFNREAAEGVLPLSGTSPS